MQKDGNNGFKGFDFDEFRKVKASQRVALRKDKRHEKSQLNRLTDIRMDFIDLGQVFESKVLGENEFFSIRNSIKCGDLKKALDCLDFYSFEDLVDEEALVRSGVLEEIFWLVLRREELGRVIKCIGNLCYYRKGIAKKVIENKIFDEMFLIDSEDEVLDKCYYCMFCVLHSGELDVAIYEKVILKSIGKGFLSIFTKYVLLIVVEKNTENLSFHKKAIKNLIELGMCGVEEICELSFAILQKLQLPQLFDLESFEILLQGLEFGDKLKFLQLFLEVQDCEEAKSFILNSSFLDKVLSFTKTQSVSIRETSLAVLIKSLKCPGVKEKLIELDVVFALCTQLEDPDPSILNISLDLLYALLPIPEAPLRLVEFLYYHPNETISEKSKILCSLINPH